MRRVLICILTMILLFSLFPESRAASIRTITLEVDFHGNIFFSKYDVDLYLDNQMQTTLTHGKDYTTDLKAEDGQHTLVFYKHDSKEVYGGFNFEIESDVTLKCSISCRSNNIDISNVKMYVPEPRLEDYTDEEIQDILKTVPAEYFPKDDIGSPYYFMINLDMAVSDGKLSPKQKMAVLSTIKLNEKEYTHAFINKGNRGTKTYIVLAFDINKASKTYSGSYSETTYGDLVVEENSRIKILWNNGGTSWYYIEKGSDGKEYLLNSSKEKTGYVETESADGLYIYVKNNSGKNSQRFYTSTDPTLVKVGDIIQFGHYPQTLDEGDNSPIDWVVVRKTNNNVLLLSKKIHSIRPFHNKRVKVSWNNSDLRKWLNNDFKAAAFTKDELKAVIPLKRNGTTDTVSLMTFDEANEIFIPYSEQYSASESRKDLNIYLNAVYTDYAIKELTDISEARRKAENSDIWRKTPWWLSTVNNSDREQVLYTGTGNYVEKKAIVCTYPDNGVRPLIQLNLTKAQFAVESK